MKKLRINGQIKALSMRLIDQNGEQVGVVDLTEALAKAKDAGLDLVEISPDSTPPVCKILDYSKHLFEEKKKVKKNQKQSTQTKEIKFGLSIGDADYDVKMKNAIKFLQKERNKTKITLKLKGREITNKNGIEEFLLKIKTDLAPYAEVDSSVEQGKNITILFLPKKV